MKEVRERLLKFIQEKRPPGTGNLKWVHLYPF